MKFGRRQLLTSALAASFWPEVVRASPGPKQKILVAGAGIAGLSAGRTLADQGHDVVILEARDRIGGRVHTSRVWPDLPVDLGASWVHGTTVNPLMPLVRRAGMRFAPTSYDHSTLHIDPALRAKGVTADDHDWAENLVEAALERAARAPADMSVRAAINAYAPAARLSAAQAAQLEFYLAGTYEQEYSGSAERLSAAHIDDGKEFEGPDVLFPAGYDALPRFLASGLTIHRNAHVRAVARMAGGVTLTCADGSVWAGDRVIVTVPLGALKAEHIRFSPPLPSAVQASINRLEMGLLNKHFLRFETPFWPKAADWHELLKAEPGRWSQWVSFAAAAGKPVLLGFTGADAARGAEAMDDRAILAEAMAAVRAMFGNAVPDPVAWQFTRWGQDALTLGSYSFTAVGSGPDDRRALSRVTDDARIHFAGEACSPDYPGTVHGALLSGRAVAKAIMAGQ